MMTAQYYRFGQHEKHVKYKSSIPTFFQHSIKLIQLYFKKEMAYIYAHVHIMRILGLIFGKLFE